MGRDPISFQERPSNYQMNIVNLLSATGSNGAEHTCRWHASGTSVIIKLLIEKY